MRSNNIPLSALDREEAGQSLLDDAPARPKVRFSARFSRRVVAVMVLVVLSVLLYHTWPVSQPPAEPLKLLHEDSCFVSVLHAYEQDLRRHSRRWNALFPRHSGSNRRDGTGHLVLGDDAPHPIPELLTRGETRYLDMLSGQSKTLEEAEDEYRRRYRRETPKWFPKWYEFAAARNALFIDEFDNIEDNFAPFRDLSGAEMRKRLTAALRIPQSFAYHIKDGEVSRTRNSDAPQWTIDWRGPGLEEVIKPLAKMLPDMPIPLSAFDEPMIYAPYARKHHPGSTPMVDPADDAGHVDWHEMCAPDSNVNHPQVDNRFAFVDDAVAAGDACKNPYLLDSHGIFLQPHDVGAHPRPYNELLPMFGFSPHSLTSDIMFTPTDQFDNEAVKDAAWEDKADSRLGWRGSNTGMPNYRASLPWRKSHRIRLHEYANNASDASTSILAPVVGTDVGIQSEDSTVAKANSFFFDMGLAGDPIQCDAELCDLMKSELGFFPRQSSEDLRKHKFLFDIDGNAWSGRFRRLMSTNSLVVKASVFPRWFQPKLIEWFMYVPARFDFTDLYPILAFFRGSPDRPNYGFDTTAKAIAVNGRCFVEKMFRRDDIQVYMLRVLLEWADLIDESRD